MSNPTLTASRPERHQVFSVPSFGGFCTATTPSAVSMSKSVVPVAGSLSGLVYAAGRRRARGRHSHRRRLGQRPVHGSDGAGVGMQAQVLAGIADDADAIDGRIEVEAKLGPVSAGVIGAPMRMVAPVISLRT